MTGPSQGAVDAVRVSGTANGPDTASDGDRGLATTSSLNHEEVAVSDCTLPDDWREEFDRKRWRHWAPRAFWDVDIDRTHEDVKRWAIGTPDEPVKSDKYRPGAGRMRVDGELHRVSNLVIAGPVGTGKTWAVYAAFRPLLLKWEADVLVLPAREMFRRLRPDQPDPLTLKALAKVEFLAVDDLSTGVTAPTAFEVEQMQAIVDERDRRMLPTIVTTNVPVRELRPLWGDRTYDRLTAVKRYVGVWMGGESKRGDQ